MRENKKYLYLLFIIPIVVFFIGRSFSVEQEVKSIEIESYNYDDAGSFHIEKSAKWVGLGKAEVTFNVRSIEKDTGTSYKDIIMVIDTSGSMYGDKINRVKDDAIELANSILDNPNNRIALITFSDNATLKSNLTDDKNSIIELLSNINISGNTNYNAGLLEVDNLLKNYHYENNRDVVMLFLTDGFPNEASPNEKATYGLLKDRYSYMTINGIQYEMGEDIVQDIVDISDYQWIASMDSLRNVLFDASVAFTPYDTFVITDIINKNNFTFDSETNIKVNRGTATLLVEDGKQKVKWDLSHTLSGLRSTMTFTINLKDAYLNTSGLYDTNEGEIVVYKIDDEEDIINSSLTPKLKNQFKVSYDTNTPTGCTLATIDDEYHFVGSNVNKKTVSLKCSGYQFRKWEIIPSDAADIKMATDDVFIMPDHDVTIRATWTKQAIVKSMNGEVQESRTTLYGIMQDKALDGIYAKEYKGPHQDSNTKAATKKIYHWYADRNDNTKGEEITNMYHVAFAGYCWRMIRTTDQGGVRLLYNGDYDETLKCGDDRTGNTHIRFDRSNDLVEEEEESGYFADSYTFDANEGKFILVNPELQSYSLTNHDHLIGKYYCKDNQNETSCSSVYKIYAYSPPDPGYTWGEYLLLQILYQPVSWYSSDYIGSSMVMNSGIGTIAASGYMYGDNLHEEYELPLYYLGDIYFDNDYSMIRYESINSFFDNFYNKYVSSSYREELVFEYGRYETYYIPINPVDISTITDYNDLIGKYVFDSEEKDRDFKYVVDVKDNNVYITEKTVSEYDYNEFTSIYVGDSITENSDYTYTINNATEIRPSDLADSNTDLTDKIICVDGKLTCTHPIKINENFVRNYSSTSYIYLKYEDAATDILIAKSHNGLNLTNTRIVSKTDLLDNYDTDYSEYKYTCGNKSSTCTEDNLRLIYGTGSYYGNTLYVMQNDYYFGSDVTWDGTKYTLVDPVEFEVYRDDNLFSHHHYFCLGKKKTSCETVFYITHESIYPNTGYIYGTISFIELKNGEKNPSAIFDQMMKNNTHDSILKMTFEEWYELEMLKYDSYIEDSVYCNDRKPSSDDAGWLRIDGNIHNTYRTRLSDYNDYENYLSGYADTPGNYRLSLKCELETDRFSVDNPKAKLKYPVATITYDEISLFGNTKARALSTTLLSFSTLPGGSSIILRSQGNYYYTSGYYNVAPEITLKYGTQFISGDGSKLDPYYVDTSDVDG